MAAWLGEIEWPDRPDWPSRLLGGVVEEEQLEVGGERVEMRRDHGLRIVAYLAHFDHLLQTQLAGQASLQAASAASASASATTHIAAGWIHKV